MAEPSPPAPPLERLSTGVPRLDQILRGGIPRGSVVLVAGAPGTGKTTLGNQLAFAHAAGGGRVIFASVLAETHDRLLAHMAGFTFFDSTRAGSSIQYLSLLGILEEEGMEAVLDALRRVVREQGAGLLVVDGTATVAELATSRLSFGRFVNRLQVQSALLGCTTLLLINPDPEAVGDLATHPDGLVVLRQERAGSRRMRTLEVAKLRGADPLGGHHEFAITETGVALYPRLEAALAPDPVAPEPTGDRLGFGLPGLDAMLGGGLLPGSSTLLMGTPGAGKTLTGLHLLVEGARRSERGLIAGFHESPERLIRTAAGVGLDLAGPVAAGLVQILWRPPLELSPDAWAWDLLAAVAAHRPHRLLVDALTDVERRIPGPDRPPDFVAALAGALRAAGVTTLFNAELSTLVGPELRVPLPAVSVALDALILLRHFEWGSRLQRLVSILKERETAFDPTIREFIIGAQGIVVGEPFGGATALLTGAPRTGLTPEHNA